MKHWG